MARRKSLLLNLAFITRPEIAEMATLLGASTQTVLGLCVEFWVWAAQNTIRGVLSAEEFQAYEARPECQGFLQALITVQWMRQIDGGYQMASFDDLAPRVSFSTETAAQALARASRDPRPGKPQLDASQSDAPQSDAPQPSQPDSESEIQAEALQALPPQHIRCAYPDVEPWYPSYKRWIFSNDSAVERYRPRISRMSLEQKREALEWLEGHRPELKGGFRYSVLEPRDEATHQYMERLLTLALLTKWRASIPPEPGAPLDLPYPNTS